jgi:hypothetical protein
MMDKLVYDKYYSILNNIAETITLRDEQYEMFKFKPDLLSAVIYENPNLSHLILFINNCAEYEFNKKIIKLISPANLDIFTEILRHETNTINKNKEEVG